MVITNGRMVSLAECELRSKASKTRTVPNIKTTKAMPMPTRVFQATHGMVILGPVLS